MNNNNYKNQKIRGLKRKYEAMILKGGKCEICGYNKNIAALEFHHIDPNTKKFQLDMRHFSNTTLETLKQELDKCILICANCHRELHNKNLTFNNVKNIIINSNKESFNNEHGQICPVCGKKFPKSKNKKYCSKECRIKDKNYPSIDEINEQYKLLKNWEKVAKYFNLTRKIIQGIRKRNL